MLDNTLIQEISNKRTKEKGIKASVLRLDLIHPVVSGNKIFKLQPYLKLALEQKKEQIVSFGGAHSNHLVATAYAAKENGLKSIGYIRGEAPPTFSETLLDCIHYGMVLKFTSRETFDQLQIHCEESLDPKNLIIPYGGYGRQGAIGAKTILESREVNEFDTILASCGSGTMGAGLVMGLNNGQKLILVSALKNNISIETEIKQLLEPGEWQNKSIEINFDYHFGGFAKKNAELFAFMNSFYEEHQIPTDFVYTGKLAFAFNDMLMKDKFSNGAKVLLIHSGGLQGNRSLKNKELIF